MTVEEYLRTSEADARDHALARIRRYVEHETPSGDAEAIDLLSRRIEAELLALGASVEGTPAPERGRNLRATIQGSDPALAPVLVLAHIDTVHPVGTLITQPFRVEDGRAEGPGIYDMKSGLALMIEALELLRMRDVRPRRPVRLLVTCDEEIGSHTSAPLMEAAAKDAYVALVPEPCLPDGGAKTARKGVMTYTLEIRGRAGHAGVNPEDCVSAITELSRQMPRILAVADHAKGTTINIGVIRGGTASNVVAAHALAEVDVRIVEPEEAKRVDAAFRALVSDHPEAHMEWTRAEYRPPLVRTPDVVRLYEHARTVAAGLDRQLKEGASGGGSDGSIVAALGVPTLDGLGPNGGGAHAANEHIRIDDLPFRLALYARLFETL